MRGQPDAVTEAVPEMVAVTGRGDHVPCHLVDRLAGRQRGAVAGSLPDCGLEPGDRLGLGACHELVDIEVGRLRLADEQRPRHVASIAGDLRPAVEQQHRAVQDGSIAGRAVRQRRLWPRQASHIEGECLGAAGPDQPLQLERQRRLGHARPDLGKQRRQRPVGDDTRRRDPLDLGWLFDRPVGLEPAFDRHELDVRCGCG
jgi:hypothetical protein